MKQKQRPRDLAKRIQAGPSAAYEQTSPIQVAWPDGRIWIPVCDALLRPQGMASIAASTQLPTGNKLTIPCAGWLIGWRGTTAADGSAAGLASMFVRITINGSLEIISDGSQPDYSSFDEMFPRNGGFAPIRLFVRPQDQIDVWFWNKNSGTAYTPSLTFAFLKKKSAR